MSERYPIPFLGDEVAATDPSEARVSVLPVPYEATVSWKPGTAGGPRAILDASPYLEFYDEQLDCEPWRSGIWTEAPVDLDGVPPEQAFDRLRQRFGELLDTGRWPIALGGEHSITPGMVHATADRHEGLTVVQVDAHADLRQSYGGSAHNHACAMARCVERVPVVALGIRSYTREERDWMAGHTDRYGLVHAWEIAEGDRVRRLLDRIRGPVYLTFDVDGLDPSIVPATGTPEPGGLEWYPTLGALEQIFRRFDVVAADVVELAPSPELHHADFTVARLVHKLIGMRLGRG